MTVLLTWACVPARPLSASSPRGAPSPLAPQPVPLPAGAPAPVPPARRAELWLGGDVNLGQGGREVLAPLARLIRGAPGIINLEGPVSVAPPQGAGLRLYNAPRTLPELRALGVAVVGIANNHASDAGPEGPRATARALVQAGLLPSGAGAGPAVLEMGGLRIAITAHDLTAGVPPALEPELRAARAKGDVLVATFHVTGPALYLPRPELRRAVELALAAGASVVAAQGTHALGPLERRGAAVIAWGLGNVAFSCDCTDERDAVLLRIRFEQGRPAELEVLPIEAGLNGAPAKPSVDPAGVLELLESMGTAPLRREGGAGRW